MLQVCYYHNSLKAEGLHLYESANKKKKRLASPSMSKSSLSPSSMNRSAHLGCFVIIWDVVALLNTEPQHASSTSTSTTCGSAK